MSQHRRQPRRVKDLTDEEEVIYNNIDFAQLASLVREFPILYKSQDAGHGHPYGNNRAKQKIWAQIDQQLNVPAGLSYLKFRQALGTYRNEKKKFQRSSESDQKHRKGWHFYDCFDFVDDPPAKACSSPRIVKFSDSIDQPIELYNLDAPQISYSADTSTVGDSSVTATKPVPTKLRRTLRRTDQKQLKVDTETSDMVDDSLPVQGIKELIKSDANGNKSFLLSLFPYVGQLGFKESLNFRTQVLNILNKMTYMPKEQTSRSQTEHDYHEDC